MCFFVCFFNLPKLLGQSGEAGWSRVCYQLGLPHLINRPGVAGAVL